MTKIKREVRPSVRDYQLCSRCVMDTSDADITFDSDGVCNHCHEFDAHAARMWKPGPEGEADLAVLVERMKKAGLSSSCLLYWTKRKRKLGSKLSTRPSW